MWSFILKNCLVILIFPALIFLFKKWYEKKEAKELEEKQQEKLNHEQERQKEIEEFKKISDANTNDIRTELATLQVIKDGILMLQGLQFKQNCRKLKDDEHEISDAEWEDIGQQHQVYNALGGNHEGDQLFMDVQTKYYQQAFK